MPEGPRVLVQTEKFRIVEGANGNKSVERFEGYDAMGGERWRDLKFGEAEGTARMLRDWMFDHCRTCPAIKEQANEHRQRVSEQLPESV